MTETTETQTTYTKPLAMAGTGLLALALLTGCTTTEPEAGDTPADGGATTTATATTAPIESSPAASTPGTGTPTEDGTSSPTGATGTTGEDPVYAAIDAVYGQHPDAFVVQVDREDDGSAYEVEAHLEGEILEFTVMTDGSVREDDRDGADDHLRSARDARVTAEDAAQAALEGREGQLIDEMELEDEDGTLVWKVELDRENGDDGEKLHVDAMTGEVSPDR